MHMKLFDLVFGNKLTPQDAVDLIRSTYPDLQVVSCKDYRTDYLITAYKTPNDMDPFFLVDKRNGSITGYTIAMDPDRYYETKNMRFE